MSRRNASAFLSFSLALLVVLGGALQKGRSLQAQEKEGTSLPLTKVVLFSSGVGFYEHSGLVSGDARVDFRFRVEDVNDLLKSMVVQDLGGGKIAAVNYGSKDPITRTLKTFAIDLTSNPTLADLLGQVRGEKVEVHAPNAIVGMILGVEHRQRRIDKDEVLDVAVLNLLTEEGLRAVLLENVSTVKLLNEKLDAELRQALMVLALGKSADKKTVSLNFIGEGQRQVRVGYIQESPLWKTSYRLVLQDDEKPYLQGWAIVENTSEADWKDVNLTLVSGRPISFRMDLYEPLYVPRPLVEPELFASLRPQTYGQDLASRDMEFAKLAEKQQNKKLREALAYRRNRGEGKEEGRSYGYLADKKSPGVPFDIRQGVQSLAQASDVGELFQYEIESPVTLPRQQSAMLPIVNGAIEADKVSIYNASVHAKHPLNGLRLTNSTGLHLMQGPITVFDAGVYAGDAQIQDLPPGTKRLISYAMDLDTEVAPTTKSHPEELVSCRLIKGVLYTKRKYRRTQGYTIKNSGSRAKTVLIEYPLDSTWKLVEPKNPEEKTRDRYRFAVAAAPGKPASLTIQEEYTASQSVVLNNTDDNTIRIYIRAKVVSDEIKAALTEVIRRKQELSTLASQRRRLEQQLKIIDQEQARIRQNMAQLSRSTDLYNRYVQKFTEQEDRVEQLRGQIEDLIEQEAAKKKSLDAYLIGLSLS